MNNKFSLLVPCYNAEKYIEKFIANILALKSAFDEVIFYDDASTDNTFELIKSKGYPIIKGNTNGGPGYARNKLAETATGNWIHFHDIDDGLHPDYLIETSKIAAEMVVDVILCNVTWYDAKTEIPLIYWKYSNDLINKNPVVYTISNPIGGINGMYNKEFFLNAGGFDTEVRIWEDSNLHVKLAAEGAKFYVIEKELTYSLRYEESISSNQNLGWLIRLEQLQKYATHFTDQEIKNTIGIQAQFTASRLIMGKQYEVAKDAFLLSEKCNLKVPYSNNLLWKILKFILPKTVRIKLRILQLKSAFN